ncbi:hypothetical protein ACTXJ5_09985 [Psychrobacter alimentarius]|uniref:hypothetical protein n=1 Tax=Psychrobacter alimentarius TaxID=261164 RepID=UPI003FD561BE
MNKLSMINVQQKSQPEVFYSELIVDGIIFGEWLSEFTDKTAQFEVLDIKELGLSINLDIYSDTKLVWYYLGQLNEGSISYVPLLVCSDDNDLSCTVIATEQKVINGYVKWKRFGRLKGFIQQQNPDTIDWFEGIPELTFDKDNFESVFGRFKKDFTEAYQHQGEFEDIDFPKNSLIENYLD